MEIRKEFINRYINKLTENDYIGVEIEMPIINLESPYIIDSKIIQKLFQHFLLKDFVIQDYDNDGNVISIKNIITGDKISLEYSFNTIELSLNKELNIYDLQKKFVIYYDFILDFLKKYNYKIYCGGLNPNYKKICCDCLNHNRYKVIERLLLTSDNKLFDQFCSYCCSVQTHINVSKRNVVDILNMLTDIEDNKSYMFANSYMKETKLKNSRKFLWENSNFGPLNIGKNKKYNSLDDLINDYLKRNLFFVERNNKFLLFDEKQPLDKYFDKKCVIAIDNEGKKYDVFPSSVDFDNFRSYKSVELTKYGTIEIRTDCTPNIKNIFRLVAFNVGICKNYKKILKYLEKNNNITNQKLIEFSIKGLEKRSFNEEKFLEE